MRATLIALICLSFLSMDTGAQTTMSSETADARIQTLIDWSRENRRGLTFYVNGQQIDGVVKEVLADAIVVGNQERATIVIRRSQIDAVAGQ